MTAWTNRVSNPGRSPRFRTSASDINAAPFSLNESPPNFSTFHIYIRSTAMHEITQAKQYLYLDLLLKISKKTRKAAYIPFTPSQHE